MVFLDVPIMQQPEAFGRWIARFETSWLSIILACTDARLWR
jgi:hypothetical protein